MLWWVDELKKMTPVQPNDWARGTRFLLIWCLPLAILSLSVWIGGRLQMIVWPIVLPWMGAACLLNAWHCRRLHCYSPGRTSYCSPWSRRCMAWESFRSARVAERFCRLPSSSVDCFCTTFRSGCSVAICRREPEFEISATTPRLTRLGASESFGLCRGSQRSRRIGRRCANHRLPHLQLPATRLRYLDRWTRHRTIRTEDAAVSGLWP